MNSLHATTDPPLIDRLQQMLTSSERADIAVGYFFMSGFQAVDSVSEGVTQLVENRRRRARSV